VSAGFPQNGDGLGSFRTNTIVGSRDEVGVTSEEAGSRAAVRHKFRAMMPREPHAQSGTPFRAYCFGERNAHAFGTKGAVPDGTNPSPRWRDVTP